MAWNYRVFVNTSDGADLPWYHIREAYYDAGQPNNAEPKAWGGVAAAVGGEDLAELTQTLLKMRAALDKPVLDENGKEWKP